MFKKLLKTVKLFSFLLLIINFVGISAFSYEQNVRIVLDDPYICGQNIVGSVIGGTGLIDVTVEIFRGSELVITYEIEPINSGDSYQVDTPHKDVPVGKYTIISTAVDSLGETDVVSFNADIRPSSECSTIETVRTGASKLFRENVLLIAISIVASSYGILFLAKNRKMKIER
jgi:hypothetical protein